MVLVNVILVTLQQHYMYVWMYNRVCFASSSGDDDVGGGKPM